MIWFSLRSPLSLSSPSKKNALGQRSQDDAAWRFPSPRASRSSPRDSSPHSNSRDPPETHEQKENTSWRFSYIQTACALILLVQHMHPPEESNWSIPLLSLTDKERPLPVCMCRHAYIYTYAYTLCMPASPCTFHSGATACMHRIRVPRVCT